jgi:uncharacterized membrane protein (DUF4010 family)
MELGGVPFDQEGWRLAVALGIGLLMGVERERHKGIGPGRAPAGIRTFALVSLIGGICMVIGNMAVLAVALAFVAAAILIAYAMGDRDDPGLTSEAALLTAFLLGALAQREPELAAGLAVTVTILLAIREQLHRLVSQVLTEQEIHDGLLFAGAALVVLPLLPSERVGPYGAFDPYAMWRLVIIVMAISAAGYIAQRMLGSRVGLPLAGFAGGFISSSATIGSMGGRASREPRLMRPAVAAAVLSTVATVVQMVVVVGATSMPALREIGPAMVLAGIAAAGYGALFALRALREPAEVEAPAGRAFEPRTAIAFAVTVTAILLVSAALNDWLGNTGLIISTAVAGFADTHSAAISVASLVAAGKISAADAVIPILGGLTTNSVTKAVLALTSGGRPFARAVWPGIVLVAVAAWGGAALSFRW